MSTIKAAGFIVYHPDYGIWGCGPTLEIACADAVKWSEDDAAGNPSRGPEHHRDQPAWRFLPCSSRVLTALDKGAGCQLAWVCVDGVAVLTPDAD